MGYSPDAALLEHGAVGPHDPMAVWAGTGRGLSDGVPFRSGDWSRVNGSGFSSQPRVFVGQKEDHLDSEDTVGRRKFLSLICLKTRRTIHTPSAASLQCLWWFFLPQLFT